MNKRHTKGLPKLTVNEIQRCLYSLYIEKGYKYFSQNSFGLGKYEVDYIAVHPENMFTVEFEIKRSKSDFRADFKKGDKHILLKKGLWPVNQFYFVCQRGILDKNQIPSHLGLITIEKIPYYKEINKRGIKRKIKKYKYDVAIEKKAKVLHQRSLSPHILLTLLTSVMHKFYENYKIEKTKNE